MILGSAKARRKLFEKWDKAAVLKDVVTIIRRFKPDVIICRFPTTGEGGHWAPYRFGYTGRGSI